MKDKFDNIEDLFKESFDQFEADVDPNMWNNIANQLSTQGGSAGQAGNAASGGAGSAGLGVAKIAAIIGAAGVLSFAGYQLFKSNDEVVSPVTEEFQAQKEVVSSEIQDETVRPILEESFEEPVVSTPTKKDQVIEENTSRPAQKDERMKDESLRNDVQENSKPATTPAHEPVVENNQPVQKQDQPVKKQPATQQQVVPVAAPTVSEPMSKPVIYASKREGEAPFEVRFESRGNKVDHLVWKFRDNASTADYNYVTHTFETMGDHWVVLEIADGSGRVSKDSIKIKVHAPTLCKVPESVKFSPNGDGIADVFKVECKENIKTFHGIILNRNGAVLYEWNDTEGGWDGRDKQGNSVPMGAYFFVIEYTSDDGIQREPVRGIVNLYR